MKDVKTAISERAKIKTGIKAGDIISARRQTASGSIVTLEGVVTKASRTRSHVLFSNGDPDTYKQDEELKVKSRRTPKHPTLAFCAVSEIEDTDTDQSFYKITPVFKGSDDPAPFACVVTARGAKYANKLAERIMAGEFISDLSYVVKRGKLIVEFEAEFPVYPNTTRGIDKACQSVKANTSAVRKLVK